MTSFEVSVHPDPASAEQPIARLEGRGVPAAVLNAVMVAPFNDLDAMETLLRRHHQRIAAIIVEADAERGRDDSASAGLSARAAPAGGSIRRPAAL